MVILVPDVVILDEENVLSQNTRWAQCPTFNINFYSYKHTPKGRWFMSMSKFNHFIGY